MDTERMIRQLKRISKEHENDRLNTFELNISDMCKDVANRLEEQYNLLKSLDYII